MSDRRIYPDELCHYGILGMKWGKRNGPPYPLDAKDHSASEKKAGWRQSLKAKSQKVRAIKDARKNVSSARDEYSATLQKVNDIRSKTNYEDGVFEKLQRAIYTQSDKDWSKYNKSYNQQLAKNEEYQKLISKLELDKVRLDDLERLSQTKIGSVYFSSMK